MNTGRERRDDLLASLMGGIVALAVLVLARDVVGTRLLAELTIDASTQILQPRGFSGLIEILGSNGKPLLFLTVLIGQLCVFILAWRWAGRLGFERRAPVAAAIALAMLVAAAGLIVAATEARMTGDGGWLRHAAVDAVACAVFAAIAWGFSLKPVGSELPSASRRALVFQIPALLLAGVAASVVLRRLDFSTGTGVFAPATAGKVTSEVTSNEDFYVISKNLIDPKVDGSKWRLRVGGLSRQMLELTLDDVRALPEVEQFTTLQCISNDVGGPLIGNASWRGVRLGLLLNRAGLADNVSHVLFRSDDDYTETLPIDLALRESVILAHTMNDERLPDSHGFPLRLLAPGRYGMNQPKWITEIVMLDKDMLGYWGKRAWSPRAPMATSSRIDVPAPDAEIEGPMRIHGIAYSGDRGISRLEVSVDDGASWREAVMKPALSPYTWVLWHYDWSDIGPGGRNVVIKARATDGDGNLQSAIERPPYPAGATGLPAVSVRVKGFG